MLTTNTNTRVNQKKTLKLSGAPLPAGPPSRDAAATHRYATGTECTFQRCIDLPHISSLGAFIHALTLALAMLSSFL